MSDDSVSDLSDPVSDLPVRRAPDASLSPAGRAFRPVVLMVLDGWGYAQPGPGNAVSLADTPVFDRLWASYPHGTLIASGEAVGLPAGQMGNSEVGHLNIGAGRVVYQDLTRISKAIEDGSFFENAVLQRAFADGLRARVHDPPHGSRVGRRRARRHGPPQGVHRPRRAGSVRRSSWCTRSSTGATRRRRARPGILAEIEAHFAAHGYGRFGTVSGRYYAMDRDTRWDRVKLAYDALVYGDGSAAPSAAEAVAAAYERGETDEFVKPTVVGPPA